MFVPSRLVLLGIFLTPVTFGCGPKQPTFDNLYPVSGKITHGGQPPGGGGIEFKPIPAKDEFMINGVLDAEGNFKLSTVRSTDTTGERKNGAPAGEYNVIFMPKNEDQTKQFVPPVTLPKTVTIEAKENVLTLDAPK